MREVLEDEVEGEEDRELSQQRDARGRRIDVVLAVELHQFFLLPLLVGLVLLLDLLHLRSVALQVLHRVDLPDHQRHEQKPDEDGERNDRPGPRQADRAVRAEPLEDPAQDVLERRERRGENRRDHRKSLWPSA